MLPAQRHIENGIVNAGMYMVQIKGSRIRTEGFCLKNRQDKISGELMGNEAWNSDL